MQLPEIEALVKLAEGIELLATALPYEHAYPDAIYLRGLIDPGNDERC